MEQIKNITIIEDEVDIVAALTAFLENHDYKVTSFNSGEEFFDKRSEGFKGLYLVDWNLPGALGTQIITKIREKDKMSPIFMVSAYGKQEDIVIGLKAGADDYIVKPFNLEELLIRISNATLKFSLISEDNMSEGFKLIPEARAFIKDGTTINLTSREFVIFNFLYQNTDKPISRDQLIEQFDKTDKMTTRNIDVHIFSLRKKIKIAEIIIETVWGMGYKLAI